MTFWGYPRPDGKVGARNHIAVIASVFCANQVAQRIAQQVQGAVALTHPLGCGHLGWDLDVTLRTLRGFGRNPNVAAALVVGLGCERLSAFELADGIATTGKRTEAFLIQEAGGSIKAIEKGITLASEMVREASRLSRQEFPLDKLVVALKCGGTDATSGIAANPAVGMAADRFLAEGASALFCEVTELLGAEHLLAKRAVSPAVARKLLDIMQQTEDRMAEKAANPLHRGRGSLVAPGNIDGGVTTVEEKALGGMRKAGTGPIHGVLAFAEEIPGKGLYLMDTPGHDAESVTSMVAAGAQVVLFTTGRGTPTGCPIAPVIKITGNSRTYALMQDNMDINAGTIIDGTASINEVGACIYEETLAVASGKATKAEILGHQELFAIHNP